MGWSSQNTWHRRCLELKRSLHLVCAHSLFNSSVAAFVIPSSEIYFCSSSLGLLELVLATKSRDVKCPGLSVAVASNPGQRFLQVQLLLQTQSARAHPAAKADIPAPRKNSSREQTPAYQVGTKFLSQSVFFNSQSYTGIFTLWMVFGFLTEAILDTNELEEGDLQLPLSSEVLNLAVSTQLTPQLEWFQWWQNPTHTESHFSLRRVDSTSYAFVLEKIPGLEHISRTNVDISGC